jgi:hypothetical protein
LRSHLTPDFVACFARLPDRVKRLARKSYRLWAANPEHPGLQFKRVGRRLPAYSVRVGIGWRALGVMRGEAIIWFWIGSHAEYDRLLKGL